MDEEKSRRDAREMLRTTMKFNGIEDVAYLYLGYEVDPGTRYYELAAEIALEDYPLRKPTESERVEALRILKRIERLQANIQGASEAAAREARNYANQTPAELCHLREKLGATQGYNAFVSEYYKYKMDAFSNRDRREEQGLQERLREIAEQLIIKD
jgi:hypothetical protein